MTLSDIRELEAEASKVEKQCQKAMHQGGSACVTNDVQFLNVYLYALRLSIQRKRNAA